MAKITLKSVQPLTVGVPTFKDITVSIWLRLFVNKLNNTLIKVSEENRLAVNLGLSDGTRDITVNSVDTNYLNFSYSTGLMLMGG